MKTPLHPKTPSAPRSSPLASRRSFVASTAATAIALFLTAQAHATLLVYDPFDYGSAGGDLSKMTVNEAATGLDGSWTRGQWNNEIYREVTALSFGDIPVNGGRLSQGSGWANGGESIKIGSAAQAATGTLYLSYLFRIDAGGDRVGGGAAARVQIGGLQAQAVASAADSTSTALAYGSATTGGSQSLQGWTTYMAIAEFTNVGTALSSAAPGNATLWVVSENQYNWFVANGGVTATTLNAASIGNSGANTVTSRVTTTLTSGTVALTGASLTVGLNPQKNDTGGDVYFRIDEIRLATTLQEALTGTQVGGGSIPEPGVWGAIAGIVGLAAAFISRKNSRS
ncbi:MAG: hypothetical protein LBK99_02755 [Opitutaceae bacterium]|jgi:hypothetical protein|nr:hypothetical protein [Opitutaceae bacterium]